MIFLKRLLPNLLFILCVHIFFWALLVALLAHNISFEVQEITSMKGSNKITRRLILQMLSNEFIAQLLTLTYEGHSHSPCCSCLFGRGSLQRKHLVLLAKFMKPHLHFQHKSPALK